MQLDLPTDRMLASVDDDGVGWIVYNNPERRNAMSSDMLAALPAIAQAFRENDDVRVVVLRGAGDKAFVSGADLSELGRAGSSGFEIPSGSRGMYEAAGAGPLLSIEKPVIAMIQGACIGGGLLTALCADIRIAADDSLFGIPAARLGVGYPLEGVEAIVRAVGPAAASEILLTGELFGAERALELGLVNRVVEKSELERVVRSLAATIASNAPLSLLAGKAAIRAIASGPHAPSLEDVEARIAACWKSDDRGEGARAFLEKRAPAFQGH